MLEALAPALAAMGLAFLDVVGKREALHPWVGEPPIARLLGQLKDNGLNIDVKGSFQEQGETSELGAGARSHGREGWKPRKPGGWVKTHPPLS